MIMFNSLAVLARISLVILVLMLTVSVNNGEVRIEDIGRTFSKVICQGTTVKWNCRNSSLAMVIYTATYGREEYGDTVCPFKKPLVDDSVIQANDTNAYSKCPLKNITVRIMKLCDKKKRCTVTANKTYFGNHCKGVYKVLKVIYACGVPITIQVNCTNCTLPNGTLTSIPTTLRPIIPTTHRGPSSKTISSGAPEVMGVARPEAVIGVSGSLYLWFLHMKDNSSTYTTVFLLSALGAAIIMVAVVACFLTLQKKKEFLKLDIMHQPKRFIAPPKDTKTTNQNGHVPGKSEKLPDAEEAPDGMLPKGPEVVFTAHDVNNHVPKEFNIDRYSGMENGTVKKVDGTGIHVNPLFNGSNSNKPSGSITNSNPGNQRGSDAVSSLPSTPCRSRTLSEPRTGTPRRGRANSTGNVSRSHERHHSQGMPDYPDERVRLPRHLSAGNVSHHHRHGTQSDHALQSQSPARTLPRQRAATGNAAYNQSPVRNPLNWPPHGQAIPANGTSNPGIISNSSPARSVPDGTLVNQYPTTIGNLNNRQQSPGGVTQQPSPSRGAQYNSLGHTVKQPWTTGEAPSTPSQNSGSYQRANPNSPVKFSNPSNVALASDGNAGTPTPYSAHRNTPKLNRKWSEEKPTNNAAPNITTNPNYNNKPSDIWQKHSESGQKDGSGKSLSRDQGSIPGGTLQRRNVSSEKCSPQEQDAKKGTLRPPSTGELLSPLDALPETYADNPSLRISDRHSYNITPETSSFHPFSPPPPDYQQTVPMMIFIVS